MIPPTIPIPDTLKGVDELIRKGFTDTRDSCFWWLVASSIVVSVGVVLEGPELFHDIAAIVRRRRILRRFHITLPDANVHDWMKVAALLGWMLVVTGVAGEGIAEVFVSMSEGTLQTFNEILLTDATKEAGDAKTSAEGAALAASRANTSAKEIASDLAKQVKREKEAERQLEGEKKKRLELAASLLPRDLCDQASAKTAVFRFPPRKVIFEFVNEKEPRHLAEQIAWLFISLRGRESWTVWHRHVSDDTIADGVYIMSGSAAPEHATEEFNKRQSTGMALAAVLRDELTACKIEAIAGPDMFARLDPRNATSKRIHCS